MCCTPRPGKTFQGIPSFLQATEDAITDDKPAIQRRTCIKLNYRYPFETDSLQYEIGCGLGGRDTGSGGDSDSGSSRDRDSGSGSGSGSGRGIDNGYDNGIDSSGGGIS